MSKPAKTFGNNTKDGDISNAANRGTKRKCDDISRDPPQLTVNLPSISKIQTASKHPKDAHIPVDFLLLTVKDCEFSACYRQMTNPFKCWFDGLGYVYFEDAGESQEEKVKLALLRCNEGSNGPGGSLITIKNAVPVLKPKGVISVGTCSGLNPENTKLGDVVISAKLTTYGSKEVSNNKEQSTGIRTFVSKRFLDLIKDAAHGWEAPLKNTEDQEIKVHSNGELLSGPEEVTAECRRKELAERYPQAVAIDTESEGLYAAAFDHQVEWLVVKGISNNADGSESTNTKWSPFASVNAASLVTKILNDPVVFKQWPRYQGAKPSTPRTCLPSMVPHFTGRQSECEEIIGRVTSESTRLVSIWGSPGFGKTSVAIAVGHALQSIGLPVCWVSLRGLQSRADLTSRLLRFVSHSAPNAQPSVQRLSLDDELCQIISEISERSVFILDNADDLLESGLPKVKEDVMQLLEDILRQNQRVTFAITTRESLEFMNLHFQGHQGVRIRPLDGASAQTLVHELLPNASASDCTQITQICGHVPLAMKLLCSLISEDSISPSQILDDFMKSRTESVVGMLDDTDCGLRYLFDSSFQRLTAQQKEALVSLSILPENFSKEVSKAVLGKKGPITETTKILRSLRKKSLLDCGSNPGLFTMHKLLQSFAREKGESEMKETVLNAKRRLNEFYIERFEKLNEQFLTGHSMTAFIEFYKDKKSIVQSLIDGCSDSKTADRVFDVLVEAELFLDSLFWSVSEATNFNDIYDSALKASKQLGKDKYHRQLLTSKAFSEVTWGTQGSTMQLLSKRNEMQASSSPLPADEKGKYLCYLGIYQLATKDTESGIQCLHEALSLLDSCSNPEQTILRLVIFLFLIVYYQSLNDSSRAGYFHNEALQECPQGGDLQLLIIPPKKTNTKQSDDEIKLQKDTGVLTNQPLKFQIVCLLSRAGKSFSDTETEEHMCNVVLQMLKEIETKVPGSLGLFSFYGNVFDLLKSFNKIEDPVKLYEPRISYHQTVLKQCKENSFNQVHHEALAKCYLDLGGVHHSKMNYSEALKAKQRALEITIQLFEDEHVGTAHCYKSLGVTQHSLGDFTSALESAQHALQIQLKLFGEEHASTANSYYLLGITQHSRSDFTSALESAQHALQIRLKLFGEEHASTADSYYLLGITQHSLDDFTSALESAQRALNIRLKLFGEEHASTADSYNLLRITQHFLGDFTSALESAQRTLHIRLKKFGEEHASTADSYHSLGITQHSLDDFTSALESKQRALHIRLKLFGEEHASTADSYHSLGITQHSLDDFTSALESAQRALHIRLKMFDEEHASTAKSYFLLGITQHCLGDFTSALKSVQRALHILSKLFGEEHASTADVMEGSESLNIALATLS